MKKRNRRSGIYKITNKIDGKIYIGRSVNLNTRWTRHYSELRLKKHKNPILQNIWNKYGEDSLVYEIVEVTGINLDEVTLIDRENYYFNLFKPELNIGPAEHGGDTIANHPDRDKIKEKVKSRVSGINSHFYGNHSPKSEETKKRMSEGKMGDRHHNYGKKIEEDIKRKMRNTHQKLSGCRVEIDGVIYPAMKEAARQLKLNNGCLRKRLKSVNFPNYKRLDAVKVSVLS